MTALISGYGGQYHKYSTSLTIPPFVPKEYSSISFSDDSTKLVFERKITDASRGAVGWQKMNKIYGMRFPIGFRGCDKDGMVVRSFGYFPLVALYSGLVEITESIKMIFKRVILNENAILERKDVPHKGAILRTYLIVPVKLCASQRFAILLNALGVLLRGVITLGQIGLIFKPFDDRC